MTDLAEQPWAKPLPDTETLKEDFRVHCDHLEWDHFAETAWDEVDFQFGHAINEYLEEAQKSAAHDNRVDIYYWWTEDQLDVYGLEDLLREVAEEKQINGEQVTECLKEMLTQDRAEINRPYRQSQLNKLVAACTGRAEFVGEDTDAQLFRNAKESTEPDMDDLKAQLLTFVDL